MCPEQIIPLMNVVVVKFLFTLYIFLLGVFAIQQEKYCEKGLKCCIHLSLNKNILCDLMILKDKFLWARGIGDSTSGDCNQSFP